MDFKLPFILLVIGVGVAGAIPFGISQQGGVEPAMEIDMVSGQTQNPFRIQDYNDLDIFTVDVDGHVTPEHPYRMLEYFDTSIHTVSWVSNNITGTSHDGVVAEWTVNNPSGRPFYLFHDGGWATSLTKWTSAGSYCWNEVQYSDDDGASWNNVGLSWGGTFATFTPSYDSYYHTEWSGATPITGYRLVQYTGSVVTVCEIRDYSVVFPLVIPPFLDFERVK